MKILMLLIGLTCCLTMLISQEDCRLIRVVDGDTFELLCDSKKKMCRLKNVDVPELDQYYGKIVTDSLKMLIEGKLVKVLESDRDVYGRHLVKIEWDGIPLDSFLIDRGWAWHYHAFSDNLTLANVQDYARKNQCGLWQCGYNVPPWIWRSLNKRNKRFYRLCR